MSLHDDDGLQTKPSSPFQVLLDRYVVLGPLGRGGMGEVLHVRDRESGIEFALKRVPEDVSRSPDEVENLRDTFALVQRLAHPGIASYKFLERDRAAGAFYLLMEYVPGVALARMLRQSGPLPEPRTLHLLAQAAAALDHAHSMGIVHRDVKPGNLLVMKDDRVKVIDFGLAAEMRSSLLRVSVDRPARLLAGTRPYMAPEMWRGRPPTPAADQWALACTLYECLAGHPPFLSDDEGILRRAILEEPPAPIPGLSPDTWNRLLRGLDKNPDRRWSACEGLFGGGATPGRAIAGGPASAPPPGDRTARIQLRAEVKLQRDELAAVAGEFPDDLAREWRLCEALWSDPVAGHLDDDGEAMLQDILRRYEEIHDRRQERKAETAVARVEAQVGTLRESTAAVEADLAALEGDIATGLGPMVKVLARQADAQAAIETRWIGVQADATLGECRQSHGTAADEVATTRPGTVRSSLEARLATVQESLGVITDRVADVPLRLAWARIEREVAGLRFDLARVASETTAFRNDLDDLARLALEGREDPARLTDARRVEKRLAKQWEDGAMAAGLAGKRDDLRALLAQVSALAPSPARKELRARVEASTTALDRTLDEPGRAQPFGDPDRQRLAWIEAMAAHHGNLAEARDLAGQMGQAARDLNRWLDENDDGFVFLALDGDQEGAPLGRAAREVASRLARSPDADAARGLEAKANAVETTLGRFLGEWTPRAQAHPEIQESVRRTQEALAAIRHQRLQVVQASERYAPWRLLAHTAKDLESWASVEAALINATARRVADVRKAQDLESRLTAGLAALPEAVGTIPTDAAIDALPQSVTTILGDLRHAREQVGSLDPGRAGIPSANAELPASIRAASAQRKVTVPVLAFWNHASSWLGHLSERLHAAHRDAENRMLNLRPLAAEAAAWEATLASWAKAIEEVAPLADLERQFADLTREVGPAGWWKGGLDQHRPRIQGLDRKRLQDAVGRFSLLHLLRFSAFRVDRRGAQVDESRFPAQVLAPDLEIELAPKGLVLAQVRYMAWRNGRIRAAAQLLDASRWFAALEPDRPEWMRWLLRWWKVLVGAAVLVVFPVVVLGIVKGSALLAGAKATWEDCQAACQNGHGLREGAPPLRKDATTDQVAQVRAAFKKQFETLNEEMLTAISEIDAGCDRKRLPGRDCTELKIAKSQEYAVRASDLQRQQAAAIQAATEAQEKARVLWEAMGTAEVMDCTDQCVKVGTAKATVACRQAATTLGAFEACP